MRMSEPVTELHILLIEDSRTDAMIIERALRERAVPHRLTVLPDGRQALEYLFGLLDESADPSREPDLVLLDLNLPGIDGHQVLVRIKADPRLRALPVVVLTTSCREEDVFKTYQAGVNTYIPKPAEYAGYCEVVSAIRTYWLDTALPVPHPLNRAGAGGVASNVSAR
jgi:two-component system, chemotaxis family, response regulator Rcp1